MFRTKKFSALSTRNKGFGLFVLGLIKVFILGGAWVMGMNTDAAGPENLALYRPTTASSVGHYPTIAEFAVDGEPDTGWRSVREIVSKDGVGMTDAGDWLTVDLQALCKIDSIGLVWASKSDKPVFEDPRTSSLFGGEQVASYGQEYFVFLSTDGRDWKKVYATTIGAGGNERIHLEPAQARFVRVAIYKRSNPKCGVGINELQVFGDCDTQRPAGDCWKFRRKAKVQSEPAAADAKDRVLLLNRGWEMTREDWAAAGAARIAEAGLDTTAWYNATVPGTVLTTLVEQEVFPEPTIALNNLQIPESLCRHVWWYRTELAIPAEWAQTQQRLWLEFDGINYLAEIWMNGKRLGQINGAFIRGTFDITDAINKAGKNILAVRILPPLHPGIPIEKNEVDWVYNGGALGKDSPTFLASIGWDWIPPVRDRGIGIWNAVRVRRTGPVVIENPRIVTDLPLPDTTKADILITVPVRNDSDRPQDVTVQAAFDAVKASKTVTVPAHGTAEAAFTPASHPELTLKNPKLWWPVGYGAQPLYDLTLSAEVDKAVSDTHAMRFGVRELSFRGGKPNPGTGDIIEFSPAQARYVRINCLDRATNFGFSLFTVSVFNSKDKNKDLARGAVATASSIEGEIHPAAHAVDGNAETRWASKTGQPEWLCVDLGKTQTVDQVGLLWEAAYAKRYDIEISTDGQSWTKVKECNAADKPGELELSVNGHRILCRGGNWGYPEILLRLDRQRLEAAVRLHHEANMNIIRNWIGMTTYEPFYDLCDEYGILIWNDFWLANPSDGPNPDNHKLFLDNVEDTILRYRNHPSIAVWCGRNEGMPPEALDEGMRELTTRLDGTRFYQPHSSGEGVNGGGPYKYVDPTRYFTEYNHGFKTEMGMPSVPSAETMRRMAGGHEPWPMDLVWTYHDFSPQGNQYRNEYNKAIDDTFGPARDLDDYCRKAQMINYEGYRAIFEGCNHKIWNDCTAIMLWMSHPTWPSTVWQVYDYWFGTDGAFFGSKKANEPIHIQLCRADWTVEAINHTAGPVMGTVSAKVLGLDAKVLWEKSSPVTAAANNRTTSFAIAWPANLPAAYLVMLTWVDDKGQLLSENVYWLGKDKGGLKALDSMPKVKLKGTASFTSGGKDGQVAKVELTNPSGDIALMTQLTLRDADTGQRILPAYYSDNYLTLLPGESKTVTIFCSETDAGKKMKVTLSGWNIADAEIR